MLEGLEISVLSWDEYIKENFDFRLDAEYFFKDNIKRLKLLSKKGYEKISSFAYVTDGIHTSIDYCYNSNVNLFSATTPRENYFDLSRKVFISEKAHVSNPRTALKKDDIIISTVGTIGNCAVVDKNVLPANSDRHVGIIRLENDDFYPRYVSTFLLTKYGRFQTWRESTGNVQLNLFLYRIRTLKIAKLTKLFQQRIEDLVLLNDSKRLEAKQTYSQAETLLLETLNLKDFQPSKEPVNVKKFSESFGSSGRLDAEYYQVKYENYLKFIQSYSSGVEPLNEICKVKDKNFNPSEKKEYKYIELANIGKSGEVLGCTIDYGSELPTRARRKVNKNDVIISSIEGSLESCALVTKEYDNALCSTGFYVVKSEKLNPETLLVLFKSEPIQALLKKGCSGTILTAISKTELERIPIPLIDTETQNKIKEQINKSFELRNKSEHLLEVAKTAVEMAIEKDEKIAVEFIDKNCKSL